MVVGVVDALEEVDVDDDGRERGVPGGDLPVDQGGGFVIGRFVPEPCQRVAVRDCIHPFHRPEQASIDAQDAGNEDQHGKADKEQRDMQDKVPGIAADGLHGKVRGGIALALSLIHI